MGVDPAIYRRLERYEKLKALRDGGGDANEKASAARQVEEMEREFPDLRAMAARMALAVNPSPFQGGFSPPPPPAGFPPRAFNEAVRDMLGQGIDMAADRLVREVRGAVDMPEPLPKNYKATPLAAPMGERRVEIRWKIGADPDALDKMMRYLERQVHGSGAEG